MADSIFRSEEREALPARLLGMIEADRVAIIGWLWFIAWIGAGEAVGRYIFACPGTGLVWGFLIGLALLPAWPWIMPPALDEWMHAVPAASDEHHHWLPPSVREPRAVAADSGRNLRRVALVAALWFAFWMLLGAAIGAKLSKHGLEIEGAYDGFFNGAWWALLTSFAWPWFMPAAVDRWMYGSPVG